MAYFNRFEGDYDEEMRRIKARANAIVMAAKGYEPEDLDDRLALINTDEDDSFAVELEWVKVADPRDGIFKIPVRPVLSMGFGDPHPEREKNRADKGLSSILLESILPTDEMATLASLHFTFLDGKFKHEPSLSINYDGDNHYPIGYERWDSADAELMLRVFEAAFAAQPKAEVFQ